MRSTIHLICIFVLIFGLGINSFSAISKSQDLPRNNPNQTFPYQDWISLLNEEVTFSNPEYQQFYDRIESLDSLELENLIANLTHRIDPKNYQALINLALIHAFVIRENYPYDNFNRVYEIMNQMVNVAYDSQDEFLIGQTYRYFGHMMLALQRYDFASPYTLAGIQLIEKSRPDLLLPFDYLMVGGLLFDSRNYEEAIYYSKKGLTGPNGKDAKDNNIYNTIGQSFEKLNQLDSAKFYYALSDYYCDLSNQNAWKYINLQNIAELQFRENSLLKAKDNFHSIYQNLKIEVPEIAAKSLVWLAKIQLQEQNFDSALNYLNEAEMILKNFQERRLQVAHFLEDSYLVKLEVFQMLGTNDSLSFYFNKYLTLHDSLEHLASLTDLSVIRMRKEYAEKSYSLGQLEIQKKEYEQKRNAMILGFGILSAIGFTYFSWQRKKLQYKNKITLLENEAKETEIRNVKAQLTNFTRQLFEKAQLLEELEKELNSKNESELQAEYLAKLNSSRILTEGDWSEFRLLFEKVYPGFFSSIKKAFPAITPAELRISALIRLQFSAKEMATILGVSVDSVHKTRQRLRQKMNFSSEDNLEMELSNY